MSPRHSPGLVGCYVRLGRFDKRSSGATLPSADMRNVLRQISPQPTANAPLL